jgi:hypothetical protein
MKRAANKTICLCLKNIYLGFFKFYQPKATGGGFLIFEWTLPKVQLNFRVVIFHHFGINYFPPPLFKTSPTPVWPREITNDNFLPLFLTLRYFKKFITTYLMLPRL